MNRDPIPFIEELGYTPREATFLYAVGMHSGYFLRRQFDGYIGRVKGAISQHFLNKAERRGHIRALDYGQNRKVFHLSWKPIYRLLGDEDSQHRRVKGDLQVKIRLMILNYVLRDTQEHFLETEQSKVEFLLDRAASPPTCYRSVVPQSGISPTAFRFRRCRTDETRIRRSALPSLMKGCSHCGSSNALSSSMRGFSALSDGLRSFMLPTLSETSRPPTNISLIVSHGTLMP